MAPTSTLDLNRITGAILVLLWNSFPIYFFLFDLMGTNETRKRCIILLYMFFLQFCLELKGRNNIEVACVLPAARPSMA